jgi:hypothetical protein
LYLFNATSLLRFGWSNNIFPLTKNVVLSSELIQFNSGNVHGPYTSTAAYTGEIGGMIGREVSSTAAPTTGTWSTGERCWKRNPVEAGVATTKYVILGWICVATGTPGTWLEMRTLTGN